MSLYSGSGIGGIGSGTVILSVDFESQGFLGQIFWSALAIFDYDSKKVLEEVQYRCELSAAKGQPYVDYKDFIETQVKPHIKGSATHSTPDEVEEATWKYYRRQKKKYGVKLIVVAKNPFPTETGLFYRCFLRKPESRWKKMPFPLFDATTAQLVARLQHGEISRNRSQDPLHDPGGDARHAARLLIGCHDKVKNQEERIAALEQQLRDRDSALAYTRQQLAASQNQLYITRYQTYASACSSNH